MEIRELLIKGMMELSGIVRKRRKLMQGKKPKVFVSSVSIRPEYTSIIWTLRMIDFAASHDVEADLQPRLDESLLCRARIRSLMDFFYKPQYTHLMTVDDDLLIPQETLIKFLEQDKPIIGGFYRLKTKEYMGCAVRVKNEPWMYPVLDKRVVEAEYVSTGCMLVKREVIVDMINEFPDLECQENLSGRTMWALYQPFVHNNGIFREYLSEDWAFCERAKMVGHTVWAHGGVQCGHWGKTIYTFEGLKDDRVDTGHNKAET